MSWILQRKAILNIFGKFPWKHPWWSTIFVKIKTCRLHLHKTVGLANVLRKICRNLFPKHLWKTPSHTDTINNIVVLLDPVAGYRLTSKFTLGNTFINDLLLLWCSWPYFLLVLLRLWLNLVITLAKLDFFGKRALDTLTLLFVFLYVITKLCGPLIGHNLTSQKNNN